MQGSGYLIPANSKKSMLIFNMFNVMDAIIFGCGVGVSFILMMALPIQNFWVAIGAVSPGLITGLLVAPIPNYHNVRTVLANAWNFYTTRQKYIWKGWCFDSGKEGNEK